jgi:hypothetical protein
MIRLLDGNALVALGFSADHLLELARTNGGDLVTLDAGIPGATHIP